MFIKSIDNGDSPFQYSNIQKYARTVLGFGTAGAALVVGGLALAVVGAAAASPVAAVVGVGSLLMGKASLMVLPLATVLFGYRTLRDINKPVDKERENGEFKLNGSRRDVAKIRRLERKIFSLSQRFNKVSVVPEKTLAKIKKLVEANEAVASRVSATYATEVKDGLLGWKTMEEPVRNVEYRNEYPIGSSSARQILARVKLGA